MAKQGVCQECGKNFIRKKAQQLFCEPKCSKRFYNKVRRERLRQLRHEANNTPELIAATGRLVREMMELCSDHVAEKITTEEFQRRTELVMAELESLTQLKQ